MRNELKFIIEKKTANELLGKFSSHMKIDKNCNSEGYYFNRSLYYDTIGYRDFNQYINGERRRQKVRIRTYDYKNDIMTLEIKNKDNRKVWKDKIRGTFEKLHSIITDSSTIKNFNQRSYGNFLLTKYQYFPKITIVYQRCALICAFGSDLRITFDYNIRYGNGNMFFRDLNLKDNVLNRYDVVVMEVKFSNCMPHFLRNLLQYYELSPETFSKYCEAVKKIYKLKD